MERETILKRMEDLNSEARFNKALQSIFNTPDGLLLLEWILNLGNFGGSIRGDYACGRYDLASEVWIAAVKAAPDAAKSIIDIKYNEVKDNRQKQYAQLEQKLKEMENE